ncbi:MAG: hypothetical protein WC670_15180 [Pseudolabrys sp.]|jgi:ppGpp synthetase/RelA/SpoT-type nucleotidyltranferase
MKSSKPRADALLQQYQTRHDEGLLPLAEELQLHIAGLLKGHERVDRVSVRAKAPASFIRKALVAGEVDLKYDDPISQIQDQIGARIITFYKSDVDRIDGLIKKYFKPIEFKNRVPESEWEFGYFGHHYVLVMPSDVKIDGIDFAHIPDFFELQIKTLFQHAWSEANHDLGYKSDGALLKPDEKRKLAFTSAQAWGADQIFDELFQVRGQGTS